MVADIETAARACELEKDETNIRYKWLDLALEDMTKILQENTALFFLTDTKFDLEYVVDKSQAIRISILGYYYIGGNQI